MRLFKEPLTDHAGEGVAVVCASARLEGGSINQAEEVGRLSKRGRVSVFEMLFGTDT